MVKKLLIILFVIILLSSIISAGLIDDLIDSGKEIIGIGDKVSTTQPFLYDSLNSEIYQTPQGLKKVIYPSIVNREINGKFIPIEDTFNLTQKDEKLLIKDIQGEECQIIPSYDLITKGELTKTSFNITKNRGSWYFISSVDKEVNSVSWIINCSKEVSYDINTDNLILPNDLTIDFTQAKEVQGITTTFNKDLNKLEFTSLNKTELTKLDPPVSYNFTTAGGQGVNIWGFTARNYTANLPPYNSLPPPNGFT